MKSLGEFIKKVREDKNLTQEEVADRADLARSYISKLEDNKFKSPSAKVLMKLAKGLEVSHDSIFQAAGYFPEVDNKNLPPLDVYLRTRYPKLSEHAINEINFFRRIIEERERDKKNKKI